MLKGVKKVTAGQNDLNSHPNLGTPGKNGGGEAERSKEGHSRPKWMEEERLQKNEKGYRIEALEILAMAQSGSGPGPGWGPYGTLWAHMGP